MQRKLFSQLIKHDETDYEQESDLYSAELCVPKTSISEVENSIDKIKNYKAPEVDDLPEKLIKWEYNVN